MNDMERKRNREYANKFYHNMTPEEKKEKSKWNIYYAQVTSIENIVGGSYIDHNHTREHTLTFSGEVSNKEARRLLAKYIVDLRKNSYTFAETRLIIYHKQPGTGNMDIHMILFNVDSSISNMEYRDIIKKYWTHGHFTFDRLEKNIQAYVNYCIKGIRPDSERFLGPKQYKYTASGNVTRIKEEILDRDYEVDDSDVITTRKHKFSSNATVFLRHDAKFYYRDEQGNKVYKEEKRE